MSNESIIDKNKEKLNKNVPKGEDIFTAVVGEFDKCLTSHGQKDFSKQISFKLVTSV